MSLFKGIVVRQSLTCKGPTRRGGRAVETLVELARAVVQVNLTVEEPGHVLDWDSPTGGRLTRLLYILLLAGDGEAGVAHKTSVRLLALEGLGACHRKMNHLRWHCSQLRATWSL